MNNGWIKLHRSLLDWEWWDDINASRLLIYLLCAVNYEDKKWRGLTIKAGSMVASWETLSDKTGLTPRQCRTAMKKLEKSGEVTRKTSNKWQVVALEKWDKLQHDDRQMTGNTSDKRQTNDKQMTTTKEYKEYKEIKEEKNIPAYEDFLNHAISKKPNVDKESVKLKYEAWIEAGWKNGNGKKIVNWKSSLNNTLPYLKDNGLKVSTNGNQYNPATHYADGTRKGVI